MTCLSGCFYFQCPAFCRKLPAKKKLDSKKPTNAKKKLDSKEPPNVTSKEPPNVIEMCTMESLWTDVHYGITMESAVSFKIDVNSLSYFNYIMGGGEKCDTRIKKFLQNRGRCKI